MQFQIRVDAFLEHGYFLCSPLLNKVWCLIGESATSTNQFENNNSFYRNSFYCTHTEPWINGEFYELTVSEFFRSIQDRIKKVPKINWLNQNKEKYAEFFDLIKKEIQTNELKKVVPFSKLIGKTKLTSDHLIYFIQQLSQFKKNKTIFMYGYWDFKKQYLQLGASPELLFIKDKETLSTIALAGTSTNPEQDFRKKKMQDEHNFVLKDLCSELLQYGDVKKSRTYTVKYNRYFHKKCKISVNCQNHQPSFEKVLSSLYPSPAIGAYPRKKGLDFLADIEKKLCIHRGFFATPFGIQTKDNFMLCIGAIRGIEWSKDELSITAGGGIVAQSQLSAEWKEILLKLESIKSIFGLV